MREDVVETPNLKLSRAEWERERAAELESREKTALAVKVAGLEYDLKEARSQRDAAKNSLPKEGERVLTRTEAEGYEKYLKLGTPDEVAAAVEERDALKTKDATRERTESIAAAAKPAGFKPAVLEKLAPEGATFEVRNVKVDGKDVPTSYIKTADGKEHVLTEYAKTNFDQDFMPALLDSEAGREQQGPKWTPAGRPAVAAPKNSTNPIAAALNPGGAEAPKEVSLFSKD